MRILILSIIATLLTASSVAAQTTTTVIGDKMVVGTTGVPDGSTVRLGGLLTTGGTKVVILESDGDAVARLLGRSDLPTQVVYDDEDNTFLSTKTQRFQGPVRIESTLGDATDNEITMLNNVGVQSRFVWANAGAGAPTTGTRSAGTRLVLWPSVTTGFGDYSIGMEGDAMWSAVPHASDRFRWYGGATEVADLAGTGTLELDKDLVPEQQYHGWIGYPNRKWLTAWIAELNVETLVARETYATMGGRLLTTEATTLITPLLSTDTQIVTQHNNMASGDYLYMEGDLHVEFMKVASAPVRINKVTNNSFEDNTTGWGVNAGQTLTRLCRATSSEDSTQPVYLEGVCAARWVYTSGTSLVFHSNGTLQASTSYRMCVGVRNAETIDGTEPSLSMRVDSAASLIAATVTQREDAPEWFDACITQTSTATPGANIGIQFDQGQAATWDMDAVMLHVASLGNIPWTANGAVTSVTRNLDATGSNYWSAGSAVVNTGTCGDGFLDQYALRGVKSGTEFGPSIVGNVRTGCTDSSDYADWAPRWAAGNLRGLYGYTTDIYGFAAGDSSMQWLAADGTNGVRLMNGTATRMLLGSSNLDFYGSSSTLRMRLSASNLQYFDDAGTDRFNLDGPTGTFRLGSTATGEPNMLFDGATGDLRLRIAGATKILLTSSTGDISLVGNVRGGSATALSTGTGYFLGSTGTARFGNPSGNR
ncbi:MAG: hypothetical protein ACRD2X_16105, partial [Vicinamibacteraceae bacterium]